MLAVDSGEMVVFGLRNQFVRREISLRDATRTVGGALRHDMAPLMDQDMGYGLIHQVLTALLVQGGGYRPEHRGETGAIYKNKGLDCARNPWHPTKRAPLRPRVHLRENIAAAE
jgi:hypothetical protein